MPYRDKAKQRSAQRQHYAENMAAYKARTIASNAQIRDAVRRVITDHLQSNPCVDCGEADPIVLEFDHREGSVKRFNIGDAAGHRISVARVIAEIAKCDVRCANCHRRVTWRRRMALTSGDASHISAACGVEHR